MPSRPTLRAPWAVPLLLAALAGACREPPETPAEEAAPPGPSPVHRAWQTAKTDHARFIALAGNRDGHRHDVEVRYPRLFTELEVERRVPKGFDPDALRDAFVAHAERVGLTLDGFEASPRPPAIPGDRAIPDRLGPDEPFQWLHDEIRREVEVTFRLSPPDLERLERWFDRRGQAGPMFVVEDVRVAAGAAEVRLTAFHFVPEVKVPRRKVPPFDAEAVLRAHGVAPGGDDPRIAEIRAFYDEVNGRLEEINEALAHRSLADLWDVRNAFVHHAARRVEAQRWVDVLR